MNKRQAKKKRLNRFSSKKLLREHRRLDRIMAKCYKPRPKELEIHSCFLPWEYVIDEEEIDDRK